SDYSKQYNIDKHYLKKKMNVVKGHKDRNRDFIFGNQTPYLSSYFNWIVLDNLTLSDSKINQIEKIFFGTSSFQLETTDFIRNENVKITNITSKSTFDTAQQAWVSWIDIEITNKGTSDWFSEYATTIDLPEGCWISDYYLYVNDKKEHGLLSEKKSAMWVFSNIRNENRDPGILYYLTGNKVAFRVFPFSKGEIRKTGIEFLHKEPVQLKIDSNIVELGNHEQVMEEYAGTENIVYVSTQQKRTLKLAQRKPVVQFLVDASNGKDRYVDTFTNQIEQFVRNNKDLCENAQISFGNSFVHSYSLDKDWKQNYKAQTFGGGFYLEKAVNTTLFNAYEKKIYPIIIVVTDKFGNAI
ncbi:MAG: MSEP-CTERM sorting domain-containing protein, partial [Terrimonas sp.]|nr:MSEP-CTERM sorting domain-containing protein [Terrimonas sp.]